MAGMTLIVSECSPAARDLWRALTDEGIPSVVRTPQTLLADSWPAESTPDVLLVDAALDVVTMRGLVQRLAEATEHPPAVVCFSQGYCEALTLHVEDGLDFLVAPFQPHLVRRRLATSRQRRDLGLAVRNIEAAVYRREVERELQIGREIQRGFLPESLPVIDGWDIAAYFAPAHEVSGDFYDAYDIINGNFLGFAIADVCDKGVGAALFMALIRSLLRQAAVANDATRGGWRGGEEPEPPFASANLALHAVRTTNDYLTANHLHQAYFATLFFGVIDPRSGELVYINCGHNPPMIRRAGGEQVGLAPTGPALGLMHDAQFQLGRETLRADDLLFLYTDGVTEAKDADGNFFGEDRMRETLDEPGSAAVVLDRFVQAVTAHTGSAEQFDDVTMLGLHRSPSGRNGDRARPAGRTAPTTKGEF
ncbi:PP2C family protein-serine/threonine phosphatase [Micromonospora sp. NPDC048999]|uniref:PP2C family protein-serine/threonine phosphatase n=1 Tax=Micromonospora sp. NPDC048999 TaxID=3155391 RepID=UPI003411B730